METTTTTTGTVELVTFQWASGFALRPMLFGSWFMDRGLVENVRKVTDNDYAVLDLRHRVTDIHSFRLWMYLVDYAAFVAWGNRQPLNSLLLDVELHEQCKREYLVIMDKLNEYATR
jgi:hypothetical protein